MTAPRDHDPAHALPRGALASAARVEGRPGPGSSSRTTPVLAAAASRGRRRSGRPAARSRRPRRRPGDGCPFASARARRRPTTRAGRRAGPREHGAGDPHAPREHREHGHEREHVAVEVGLERHQLQPARDGEREQHEIRARAPHASARRAPASATQQQRPDRVPEAIGEGERVDGSSSSPSQPSACERLHARDVVEAAPAWIRTNGLVNANAGGRERRPPGRAGARLPQPATTSGDGERSLPGTSPTRRARPRAPAHSSRPSTSSASARRARRA